MSGTTKITGLLADASAVASGATVRVRWASYPAGDDFRVEGSTDGGKTFASWGRTGGPATSFSKGGLVDASYSVRVVARKSGSDIAGSTSDPITVRVGPAPATTPAPTTPTAPAPSTPAPAPSYATAADLAALRDRVAALETAVAALRAQAAAPISASGTLALAVAGQADIPAAATLTLTPQAAPPK